MKNLLITLLVLCGTGLALTAQNTWFIAPDGTDARIDGRWPTGTIDQPYRNVSDLAKHHTVAGGDIIYLRGGEYKNESYGVVPTELADYFTTETTLQIYGLRGSEGKYITIKEYPGEEAILRGSGRQVIDMKGCQWVRIEGLEIEGIVDQIPLELAQEHQFLYRTGNDTDGYTYEYRVPKGATTEEIEQMTFPALRQAGRPEYFDGKGLLARKSDHIQLVNNHVHHNAGTGLRVQDCSWVEVIGNEVNDNSRRSSGGTHGMVFDATRSDPDSTKYGDTYQIIIRDNLVHNNYNELYSWNGGKKIIEPHIDEGKGISLQRTWSQKSPPNADGQWFSGRLLCANNVTWFNGFSGVHCNGAERHDFVNNTSFFNSRTQRGNNNGISITSARDCRVINNLSVLLPRNNEHEDGFGLAISMDKKSIDASNNNVFRNNVYWGAISDGVRANDQGTTLQVADAKLNQIFKMKVDPATIYDQVLTLKNFYIRDASPAVDAGTVVPGVTPTDDILGKPRDARPDAGAVEKIIQ